MEVMFELLIEFLLQILVEVVAGIGLRSLGEPFRRQPHPVFTAAGYAIFGSALGAASLWPLPNHMVRSPAMRITNLIVTPLAAGVCMSWLGAWRSRRGGTVLRINRFWYGSLFALAFAATRFLWAH